MRGLRSLVALIAAHLRYWTTVAPAVDRELRGWERRARAIPDPRLRAHAREKLREAGAHAQITATLATIAPRRRRADVVAAIVALEVLYDVLDALGEAALVSSTEAGRRLNGALRAAVTPPGPGRPEPSGDESDYLDALVRTCRSALGRLPAAETVAPVARRTAARCGEAQARAHAVPWEGTRQLVAWAGGQPAVEGLTSWEVAAGAAASVLAMHALIAAAADPRTTRSEAERIAAAYLPACALTTMLDSLVDRERDAAAGEHRFIACYPDGATAAERIGALARRATAAAWTLRHGAHHAVTVAGVAAYYLSEPAAASAFARPVAAGVAAELRPVVGPALAVFRLWRWQRRMRERASRLGRSPRLARGGAELACGLAATSGERMHGWPVRAPRRPTSWT